MSGGRGLIAAVAAVAAAAAFAAAPIAQAAQGTDTPNRQEQVQYTADPGEANQLVVDGGNTGGALHMHDSGAVIHWNATYGTPECSTAPDHVSSARTATRSGSS
jgi:hypothetical protein